MRSLPPDMEVLFYFRDLLDRIQNGLAGGAEDLKPTEISMLLNLGRPQRMSQLAKAIYCLPSNVTVLVDKFEKSGLLVRSRMKSDRRAVEVALTEKGEETRNSLIRLIQETIREESVLQDEDFRGILEMITGRESEG